MQSVIKDAAQNHWVYKMPKTWQPFLQLSRLDRPIGYWLLALPGWIGLAFASLTYGFAASDLKWAILILIGAVAMRGAGCTYNDIVDKDLDKQVERTALRPLPAGTITTKQAWIWLLAQCTVGLIVLLCLPRLAQILALGSIPLVAAYPFMKRITWWPQVWLGLTFNWAVLVAYAAKTGAVHMPLFILYAGLIFWTIGYDTIYACQDIEDDAMAGIKSTARKFDGHITTGVAWCYIISGLFVFFALFGGGPTYRCCGEPGGSTELTYLWSSLIGFGFYLHLAWQVRRLSKGIKTDYLPLFKSNTKAAALLIAACLLTAYLF